MSFEGSNSLISAEQITPSVLDNILDKTNQLTNRANREVAVSELRETYDGDLAGIALTFEPSSRTRLSFIRAAASLDFPMVNEPNPKESMSLQKGESLADTFITLNQLGYNIIVFRSDTVGHAAEAAAVSEVPVINAGDGDGQHPTQSITDAKTIKDDFGSFEGLTIAHIGDPWNSRTVHSQIDILRPYGVKHIFSAAKKLRHGNDEYKQELADNGIRFEEVDDIKEAVQLANVVDISRFQKARQKRRPKEKVSDFEARIARIGASYMECTELTPEVMQVVQADPDKILLHPWPRNHEIPLSVTHHEQGRWKQQMENGVLTRRAILYLALSSKLFEAEVEVVQHEQPA